MTDMNQEFYLKRKAANARFRLYGLAALGFALLLLVLLMGSIFWQGIQGFQRAEITLSVPSDNLPTEQGEARSGGQRSVGGVPPAIDYQQIVRAALQQHFPEVNTKKERREVNTLLSMGAPFQLRDAGSGTVQVATNDNVTLWLKGELTPEMQKIRFSENQMAMLEELKQEGALALRFNWDFFTTGDSREPELAGYAVGIIGSLWTILVCLGVALPLGVMTALYLEEFAPRHWINDMIEVNINNLAAVPSIVFGLLGLALYLSVLGLPRGSALVGGLTLALLVLPVIIIATRAALRAVPPSIRDAARGLGASELQVVLHHVLPLALPGMMTGVILGVARALGETAPLLMIGMVAFIADVPTLATDPATVMPVQIYLWASSPEIGFVQKTAAAIMVLLVILLILNLTAVWLRNRFERRW